MPRPQKFRKLVKKLLEYDSSFEIFARRGKGSERMIYHPNVNGSPASFPVTCHGNNTEIGKGMAKAIIRRFNLPDDFFD